MVSQAQREQQVRLEQTDSQELRVLQEPRVLQGQLERLEQPEQRGRRDLLDPKGLPDLRGFRERAAP